MLIETVAKFGIILELSSKPGGDHRYAGLLHASAAGVGRRGGAWSTGGEDMMLKGMFSARMRQGDAG